LRDKKLTVAFQAVVTLIQLSLTSWATSSAQTKTALSLNAGHVLSSMMTNMASRMY